MQYPILSCIPSTGYRGGVRGGVVLCVVLLLPRVQVSEGDDGSAHRLLYLVWGRTSGRGSPRFVHWVRVGCSGGPCRVSSLPVSHIRIACALYGWRVSVCASVVLGIAIVSLSCPAEQQTPYFGTPEEATRKESHRVIWSTQVVRMVRQEE